MKYNFLTPPIYNLKEFNGSHCSQIISPWKSWLEISHAHLDQFHADDQGYTDFLQLQLTYLW